MMTEKLKMQDVKMQAGHAVSSIQRFTITCIKIRKYLWA